MTGNLFPSRLRATYRSSTRPLFSSEKGRHLSLGAKVCRLSQPLPKQYETEGLFNEKDAGHWLVVKKTLLPLFAKEVRNVAAVDLYLSGWVHQD